MNFLKEHKIQLFLLLAIVVIGIAIASAKEYTRLEAQEPNIFEEIYNEEKETFRTDNILRRIDGFDIKASWLRDSDHDPVYNHEDNPSGAYEIESVPEGYSGLAISIDFEKGREHISISGKKPVNSSLNLMLWTKYKYSEKKVIKTVGFFKEKTDSEPFKVIDNRDEVQLYLKEHGITSADLDNYYDEIVNKKVLTDWCSIYDSKFSPDNYGDITIETQWENW